MNLPLFALAPAKVNLCLYVGSRRDDGLHEICSLFQSVSLADEVTMEKGRNRDEVICPGVPEPNLALTALERFRAELGLDEPPIRITIKKNIPVAAGLGGGSADAAAVLRMCAALRDIDPAGLASLAMSLGADVPPQLEAGTALVTGAGDRVEPVGRLDGLAGVLLSGVGALSTASVYERADALGAPRADLDDVERHLRRALAEAEGDATALAHVMQNDLQSATVKLEPRAAAALGLLMEAGSLVALVSGSGPATFGLFGDRRDAERASSALAARWDGAATVVGSAAPGYAATASFSGSGQ